MPMHILHIGWVEFLTQLHFVCGEKRSKYKDLDQTRLIIKLNVSYPQSTFRIDILIVNCQYQPYERYMNYTRISVVVCQANFFFEICHPNIHTYINM